MRKFFLVICSLLWLCFGFTSYAKDTSYEAQFLDEGDLIILPYEDSIQNAMNDLAEYGNVVFLTTAQPLEAPMEYAKERYTELYGDANGLLFLMVEDAEDKPTYLYTSGIFSNLNVSMEEILQPESPNFFAFYHMDYTIDVLQKIYKALPIQDIGLHYYFNPSTEYEAMVIDDADTLTIAPSSSLARNLRILSNYGNVMLITTDMFSEDSAEEYAWSVYADKFGDEDGFLLLMNAANDTSDLYCTGQFEDFFDESEMEYVASNSEYDLAYDRYEDYVESTLTLLNELLEELIPDISKRYNSGTGYYAIIEDYEELIPFTQMQALMDIMMPITEYGNVAFVSTDYAPDSSDETAREYYSKFFGTDSGTLLLIDMDNRYIWIHSDGEVYKTINKGHANTITDNAYTLASDGDYYGCATKVYTQILALLEGRRIAQPMKYICNVFLGIILALTINFCWMAYCAYIKRPKNKEMLANIPHSFSYHNAEYVFTHKTQSQHSSGGGGGGRVGGFSGGRGGGRSGGGGGHRF